MSRELGLRIVEAVLFSRAEPVSEAVLQAHLPGDLHVADLLPELVLAYSGRGIRLERIGQDWALRTDPEIAPYLARVEEKRRKPSRAVRVSRRWEKIADRWMGAARTGWALTLAVAADRRVHAGLRAAYGFCVDLVAVTAAAFTAIALVVATYLVLAPPV